MWGGRVPRASTGMAGQTNPRLARLILLAPSRPTEGVELETFLFEGGLQVGYWRLNVRRYYLRLAAPAG